MTELTYTKNGDYLIPDLTLSETPEDTRPLGKYGRLRRSYLQEHRPGLYSRLVLSEKLFPHLREIDETSAIYAICSSSVGNRLSWYACGIGGCAGSASGASLVSCTPAR